MAISENYVEHDDGRRGVIIGDSQFGHCYHRVVDCASGEEGDWHIQELRWLFLAQDRLVEASSTVPSA